MFKLKKRYIIMFGNATTPFQVLGMKEIKISKANLMYTVAFVMGGI